MELGHNIIHGQWDWMNDPEIHSTEWEWDTTSPSVHWKKSHNFIHHKYTNVVGMDDDIGYGIMRVTRDERWERWMIGNPIYNLLLGTLFEWGVALHGVETTKSAGTRSRGPRSAKTCGIIGKKVGKQVGKDYSSFPRCRAELEAHPRRQRGRQPDPQLLVLHGDLLWPLPRRRREIHQRRVRERDPGRVVSAPDAGFGELPRRPADGVHERQPVLPDRAPSVSGPASNRYAEIAVRVRALCDKYDLPYTTGSLGRQYRQSFWTIAKLALPDSS